MGLARGVTADVLRADCPRTPTTPVDMRIGFDEVAIAQEGMKSRKRLHQHENFSFSLNEIPLGIEAYVTKVVVLYWFIVNR